jgi:hypothetical protein
VLERDSKASPIILVPACGCVDLRNVVAPVAIVPLLAQESTRRPDEKPPPVVGRAGRVVLIPTASRSLVCGREWW